MSPERADRSTPPRVCAVYIESVLFPSLSQTIAWGVFSWEHLSWWGPSFSGLTMSYVLIAQQHQRHGSKVQTWTRPLSAKRSPESLCCLHIKCGFPGYFQSSSPTTSAISRRCLQQVLEVLDIINSWAVPKYIMPWHNLSLCRKHPFPLPPGQHGTQTHSSFKKNIFYWSIVELLCITHYCSIAKWLSFARIYIIFHVPFHYGLSQDIEDSFLCYTAGPYCVSILYIIVCIC